MLNQIKNVLQMADFLAWACPAPTMGQSVTTDGDKQDELRQRLEAFMAYQTTPTVNRGSVRVGLGREDEKAVVHVLKRHGIGVADVPPPAAAAVLEELHVGPRDTPRGLRVSPLLHALRLANLHCLTIAVVDTRAQPVVLGDGPSCVGLLRVHGTTTMWQALVATGTPHPPTPPPPPPLPDPPTQLKLDQPRRAAPRGMPGQHRHLQDQVEEMLRVSMCVRKLFFSVRNPAHMLFSVEFCRRRKIAQLKQEAGKKKPVFPLDRVPRNVIKPVLDVIRQRHPELHGKTDGNILGLVGMVPLSLWVDEVHKALEEQEHEAEEQHEDADAEDAADDDDSDEDYDDDDSDKDKGMRVFKVRTTVIAPSDATGETDESA